MLSKKEVGKGFQFVLVFILITGWVFSGWPQITFHYGDSTLKFPASIQLAQAASTTVVLTTASAEPWVIPADWSDDNIIHVIGGGGGGGGGGTGGGQDPAAGGGGGAYSVITNLDLNFGDADVNYIVGVGGAGGSGTSNGTEGATSTFNGTGTNCASQSVCAEGGGGGQTTGNGGAGGAGGLESEGITEAAGSSGGTGANAGSTLGGGAGGAGGDTANGGGGSTTTGGDGGGSGAAGGGTENNAGTNGTEYTTAGSGGGGGGGNKAAGGAGGTDGAGGGGADNGKAGGAGQDGVIVIIYEAAAAAVTFTQNDYQWYVDNDLVNVAEVWGTPDLAENTAIVIVPSGNDPPNSAQELRLRVNMTVNTSTLAVSSQQFKLQFKAGTDADCFTGSWTDVGSAATWEFASSGITDGADATTTLVASDVGEEYAKSNPTETNHNSATEGQDIEYDFHIIGTNIANNTQYSFRVVEVSPVTVFDDYNTCPTLTTEPGTDNLLRHGNLFTEGVEQGFFWAD